MRDLARETKMSLNTVYKFCGSKDQLIAEAHAELRGIAGALERDDVTTRTLMRSIYSGGTGVAVARQAVTGSYHSMIDAAIGSEAIADRDAVIETLGHVINSVVINWLNNGWDAARVSSVLADAARVLVGPRASGPPRIVRE